VVQAGRAAIVLRDPLRLSEKTVIIPQHLAPVLSLCDGTRDASALSAALAVRFGLRVGHDVMERLLAAFDEAFLLENERSQQARERALTEYRQAPSRRPSLAGNGYPADADELRGVLRGYMDAVQDVAPDPAGGRGLVTPHIDYDRGGPVYARVWKQATEMVRAAELAVILGTDHYGQDGRITMTRQHYATPFGVLPTASQVVNELAEAMGAEEAFADELHHRGEHSIELAAVWLHHVRQGEPCELVPILCGSFEGHVLGDAHPASDPTIVALVDTLRQVVGQRRAIVVASGDLSHVGPAFGGHPLDILGRAQLQAADDLFIQRICAGDAEGFFDAVRREGNRTNVCGLLPIYLMLRILSPVQGEQVAYDRCPADDRGTSLVSISGIVLR